MTLAVRRRGNASGFSLVELLATMAVLSIALTVIYSFFFSGLLSMQTTQSHGDAIRTGQLALDRVARDLRQTRSPDHGATQALIGVTATSLTFYLDASRTPTNPLLPADSQFAPVKVRYTLLPSTGDPTRGDLRREEQAPISGPPAVFANPGTWGSATIVGTGFDLATSGFKAFAQVPTTATATGTTGAALALPVSTPLLSSVATVEIRFNLKQTTGNAKTTAEVTTNVILRNRLLQ